MNLRTLVPSVAALAIAAPFVQGVEITDGKATLKIGVRLQPRIEVAVASDATGDDYDIWEKKTYPDSQDDTPQMVNFMFRRARLYFSGDYKEKTKFNVCLADDKLGSKDNGADEATVGVKYASVTQVFTPAEGVNVSVQFGKEIANFIVAAKDSTGTLLLPTQKLTTLADIHGESMGLFLGLDTKIVDAYINITENDQNGAGNNDWTISGRVATPIFENMALPKRAESYCGKKSDGIKHEAGLSVGTQLDSGNDMAYPTTVIALDYLFWMDEITASFDLAYGMVKSNVAGNDDRDAVIVSVQGGYALGMDNLLKDLVIEPALRLSYVDLNIDSDSETPVYNGEGSGSGIYVDAGVNFYWNEHANKSQVALTYFAAEDGDGDAFVFRIQHQLDF